MDAGPRSVRTAIERTPDGERVLLVEISCADCGCKRIRRFEQTPLQIDASCVCRRAFCSFEPPARPLAAAV